MWPLNKAGTRSSMTIYFLDTMERGNVQRKQVVAARLVGEIQFPLNQTPTLGDASRLPVELAMLKQVGATYPAERPVMFA